MRSRSDFQRPRPNTRRYDEPPARRTGTDADLLSSLEQLDGKTYGAYKTVIGDWDYGTFQVMIDRIQADPFAPPSLLRVQSTPEKMGLPTSLIETREQRIAVADFLIRTFDREIQSHGRGAVQIARTGQEILERSACSVSADRIELRFQVQMPARGRMILGRTAAEIFDRDVPDAIVNTLDFTSSEAADDLEAMRAHVHAYEDYHALQKALVDNGWIAFVADGSMLARLSGVSQLPMEDAVAFESPESLRREVTLPHAGLVKGMAIEPGVTVIVGGGYHGKSTLLNALQRGVYAHIPGDGRELVATVDDAVKVRAADGRAVTGVDVSPLITELPGGADTARFTTENASGSTSQAASIMEAIELGTRLLLIDEDSSASNLLMRDSRMRTLVESEPITPLVDRIRALADTGGVSTLIITGGTGDYLDAADRVIMLDTYKCYDVTDRAHKVVEEQPRKRTDEPWPVSESKRCPLPENVQNDRPKTKAAGTDGIILDNQTISLADVEQIVESGQSEAIAWIVRGMLEHVCYGELTVGEALDQVERMLTSGGLDTLRRFGAREYPAFLVRPRRVDAGAALNRFRGLKLSD